MDAARLLKPSSDGSDLLELDEAIALLQEAHSSSNFRGSPRLCQLLQYLVLETVEGRGDRIKGFTIAQEVFGRTDPEDAQTSTIVSVEARRLRRRLDDYYAGEGRESLVRIRVPKGAYVPTFERLDPSPAVPTQNANPVDATQLQSFLKRKRNWLWLPAICVLLVVAIWGARGILSEQNAPDKPLIAVLPFDNLTGDSGLDALAVGMSGDITTDLAGLHVLDVVAFSSVLRLADGPEAQEDTAQAFGVTHAIFGTLRGSRDNYRVSVELVDVATGKLLWADRFDSDFSDPFKTEQEIALSVTRALPVSLSGEPVGRSAQGKRLSPDARALYEQALDIANPPSDPHRLALAEQVFRQVIDAEPEFSGGYAGAAYIQAFKLLFMASDNSVAASAEARMLAERALNLDPADPLALDALAFVLLVSSDTAGAIDASGRAVLLNPNDPYASAYHGFLLAAIGDPEAGLPHVERALRLDPLEPRTPYLNILGNLRFQNDDFTGAIEAFLQNKARGGPNGPGARATLAASYVGIGDVLAAEKVLKTLPVGYVEGRWSRWLKTAFQTDKAAMKGPNLLLALGRQETE